MAGETVAYWQAALYFLVALAYFQLMRYLDKRWALKKPFTDEEILFNLARITGRSEYDLFFDAAKTWHVPAAQVNADFNGYLTREQIPYYVTDYLRKTGKPAVERHYRHLR
jgi:hypothetical protein